MHLISFFFREILKLLGHHDRIKKRLVDLLYELALRHKIKICNLEDSMIQGFVKDVVYSISNGIPTMSRKYGLDEYFLNRFLNDDRNAFKVSICLHTLTKFWNKKFI